MMTKVKALLYRFTTGLLAGLSVLTLGLPLTAAAQSAEQRHLYDYRILYTNVTEDPECSTGSGSPVGNATVTNDLKSFVDAYGQLAFDVGKRNGIPYDAILAQASVESGYGASQLTKQANNFFGIKAGSSWTGATVTMRTREESANGASYYVDAKFEAYPTPEAGFQGYVDFLKRNPRYATALQQRDPVAYFQALKNAGYATDTKYVSTLTSRLSAVQQYIASTGKWPPSSAVTYDVAATPVVSGAPTSITTCAGGTAVAGDASGVVAIAIREAQNWTGAPDAYKKYTGGPGENWCADFVSWVYHEAGRPFTPTPGVAMRNGWQIPAVASMKQYLTIKGEFWPKSTGPAPQPGDIVIYQNGASHTNIVVEANGYMVKTVGGNQGSSNGQGAFYASSDVTMSKTPFDIRQDSSVTGWGRLP